MDANCASRSPEGKGEELEARLKGNTVPDNLKYKMATVASGVSMTDKTLIYKLSVVHIKDLVSDTAKEGVVEVVGRRSIKQLKLASHQSGWSLVAVKMLP